ncbi:MAG: hypothetical protein V3U30_05010 [Thermoplasmata archaeon]
MPEEKRHEFRTANKEVIAFSLSPSNVEGLDAEAERKRVSRSHLLDGILDDHYSRGNRGIVSSTLPPPMQDCQIQHLASRNPKTHVWYVSGSVVYPKGDAVGGSAPWSVTHMNTAEFRSGEEILQGVHGLDLDGCAPCRLAVQDFPWTGTGRTASR